MRSSITAIKPYITKDGSEIRELLHPDIHKNRGLSLAEATVFPGEKTQLHRHIVTEEIYHITAGTGVMILGSKKFSVGPGDTVCIMPGTPHSLNNSGEIPMKVLCACAPPYSHQDTEIIADTKQVV